MERVPAEGPIRTGGQSDALIHELVSRGHFPFLGLGPWRNLTGSFHLAAALMGLSLQTLARTSHDADVALPADPVDTRDSESMDWQVN